MDPCIVTRRTVHRKDANQDDIVAALRKIGCSVYIAGRPVDLVVGYRARNFLIDCKKAGWTDKDLTPFQKDFIKDWRGQVRVVATAGEAIELVTKGYSSAGEG